MTRKTSIGFIFILAASIALGGCGDKENSSSRTSDGKGASGEAAGPKAALQKMAEAYKTMDIEAVMETVMVNPEDKPFVKALYQYAGTRKAFENKLKASYSSEDLEAAGFTLSSGSNIPTPEEAENMTIEINGDQATATIPGKQPTRLFKKDGQWLVVMEGGLPPESMRQQILDSMTMTGKIYNDLMPKIGAEGVTAQDIQDEYRVEFSKAMENFGK